jgi:trigger factor
MKTDLVDINETRKNLRVEVPSAVVDAEIEAVVQSYARRARIPGFRPGKAPSRVVKQRFKEQILHDVAHELVPRAVDEALRERGVEPVDTPDIRDVNVEEGQALTFTASFDTVPAFDVGDYTGLTLRRRRVQVGEGAVEQAIDRLRHRAARYEPVEGRGAADGDIVTVDLERREGPAGSGSAPHLVKDAVVEIGARGNPPGFDEHLLGLEPGASARFQSRYPADHPNADLAGAVVSYTVLLKSLRRRVLPDLDDEFAKDLGEFETLDGLRARVREDLEHEARAEVERDMRADLMRQLAGRVPFEVPASLVEREMDRRVEELAGRLADQRIDPRQAGIDWEGFRDGQRNAARAAVAGALALDEVARRESLEVTGGEVEHEIARLAERAGRTPAALRAALEKEGGLSHVHAGLRRERTIDFLLSHARIVDESDSPARPVP